MKTNIIVCITFRATTYIVEYFRYIQDAKGVRGV